MRRGTHNRARAGTFRCRERPRREGPRTTTNALLAPARHQTRYQRALPKAWTLRPGRVQDPDPGRAPSRGVACFFGRRYSRGAGAAPAEPPEALVASCTSKETQRAVARRTRRPPLAASVASVPVEAPDRRQDLEPCSSASVPGRAFARRSRPLRGASGLPSTRADWLSEWEEELLALPNAARDDQVDAVAYAAREL